MWCLTQSLKLLNRENALLCFTILASLRITTGACTEMKRDDWDASSIFSNKQKILAWGRYHLLDSASPQILLHLQILKHLIILVFPFLFFFVWIVCCCCCCWAVFFSFFGVGVAFKLCMPVVHTRAHTCRRPSHACGSQRTTCGNQFSCSLTLYKK